MKTKKIQITDNFGNVVEVERKVVVRYDSFGNSIEIDVTEKFLTNKENAFLELFGNNDVVYEHDVVELKSKSGKIIHYNAYNIAQTLIKKGVIETAYNNFSWKKK